MCISVCIFLESRIYLGSCFISLYFVNIQPSELMKISIIQYGLQRSEYKKNYISSLYYLNEYYKRNFILVSDFNYYETCIKNYPKDYIICKKNNYSFQSCDITTLKKTDINSLSFIENDIQTKQKNIYKTFLNPISKYKMEELKNIANEYNISLKDGLKNKIKAVLYDEINLFKLNENENENE